MLVQEHREYKKDKIDGCFSVGKSKEEIYNDLKEYCNHHKGYKVFYYEHPVRPSKENYCPEYIMEIQLGKKTESIFEDYLYPFYRRAQ